MAELDEIVAASACGENRKQRKDKAMTLANLSNCIAVRFLMLSLSIEELRSLASDFL